MAIRKIIGFGGSSYVVSLPKQWIQNNGLKKGDAINLDEDSGSLRISPLAREQSKEVREININFDGNLKRLNTELVYAYIDNYSLINILGKNLFEHIKGIEETADNLVALEVMQKTPTKIVLKDCLNISDISVYDTLRRTDRIVLSMREDVRNYLTGKDKSVLVNIKHKEKDVTRLSNLIFKVLKRSFNTNDRALLKLDLNDIFYYWEVILFVEKVGDQLKRLPRCVKLPMPQEFILIFDKTMEQYIGAMKANFTRNYELAIKVIIDKKILYDEVDTFSDKFPGVSSSVIEKIKNINSHAGNVARALLKLKLESKEKR